MILLFINSIPLASHYDLCHLKYQATAAHTALSAS